MSLCRFLWIVLSVLFGRSFLQVTSVQQVSVSKLRAAADSAIVAKNDTKAAKLLTQVTKLEPNNHNNFYKLFRVHLRLKKYTHAVRDLRNALNIKPNFGSALLQLARLETKLGHCEDAVKTYGKLVACGSSCTDYQKKIQNGLSNAEQCIVLLKEAHASKNNRSVAVDALGKVVELSPLSHDLHLSRAKALMDLEKYYEVLADTGKALKIRHDSMDALLMRAKGYYKLTEHDMAMYVYMICPLEVFKFYSIFFLTKFYT